MPVEDGFGMILNYYAGDFTNTQSPYNSIGAGGMWQSMSVAAQPQSLKNLYNGNISSWELKTNGMIDNTGQALHQHGNAYEYDVLNRIKTYNEYMFDGNNWTATSEYGASYSYDPNGNLMTLQRQSQGGAIMDNFTYQYQPGTNKLITLTDAIGATPETNDIEGAHSYTYDESGNLTSDIAEDIQNIDWTLDGKVGNVQKTNESIEFAYDATGNRVLKSYDNGTTVTNTYYIRDASGLIMATYTNETEGNPPGGGEPLVAGLLPSDVKVKEWPMYGSGAQSRIGTREGRETPYTIDQPVKDLPVFTEILGHKNYEISDHLGNVRLTFRDVRVTGDKLHLTSGVDYYPFGMQKEATTFNQSGYSFGFNGMEKDDEVKGEGNSLDFGARIYDPRVGRWLSRDSRERLRVPNSPYNYCLNSPVRYVDLDGNDVYLMIYSKSETEFRLAAETRREEIMESEHYNAADDIVVMLEIEDWDDLERQLVLNNQQYEDVFGRVIELSIFSHGGLDGPVADKPSDSEDSDLSKANQLTIDEWSELSWNFEEGASAIFWGCNSADFADRFACSVGVDTYGADGSMFPSSTPLYRDAPVIFDSDNTYFVTAEGNLEHRVLFFTQETWGLSNFIVTDGATRATTEIKFVLRPEVRGSTPKEEPDEASQTSTQEDGE